MDHDWGPRLTLYLSEEDYGRYRDEVDTTLSRELPLEIYGFPTRFNLHSDQTTVMAEGTHDSLRHMVTICTIRSFFTDYLRYDPKCEPGLVDWMTWPQQNLRTISSGRVFHDGLGRLETIRSWLRYYPHDVWLYLLAGQWRRISQEEPFMARCGDVGDELGARLIAARLVVELMRLCFLLERQYAPYSKWFGTAFAQLACAERLAPVFDRVLEATHWQEREAHLSDAYQILAEMHNALQITDPLSTIVSRFHERPYLVIHSDRFVEAIRSAITDERVRSLPVHLGSIDQFVDSTDVLSNPQRFDQLKSMYR
jgi:hypothetical protein